MFYVNDFICLKRDLKRFVKSFFLTFYETIKHSLLNYGQLTKNNGQLSVFRSIRVLLKWKN